MHGISSVFFIKSMDDLHHSRFNRQVLMVVALLLGSMLVMPVLADEVKKLEKVTLQLKWLHQFQFAGYYAAQEKGYYRQSGLEVNIVEAGPTMDPVVEVTAGRAQYGVSSSALLLARQQGKQVVALAAIFQHSPLVLLARAASGIDSIHDVAGKRLMLERHSDELLAYLMKEGVPVDGLVRQVHTFDPSDLMQGKTDVISAYSTDEPFFLERAHFNYLTFSPRSGGIDFYGDNLFTTESELREHPERVKAFRAASMKGWSYAMQHPEEIADLILTRYGARHGRDYLLYEARQMVPLLQPALVEMGYMYPGRWQHIADTYAELGLLPKNFSLQGFLYDPDADNERDRRRLYLALAAVLSIGGVFAGVALIFVRLNRRLKREIGVREEMTVELQESERKFRFIAENSADVIWTMDVASGRFTYVSPSVRRLRGYSAEEVMAQPASAALSEESAVRAQAALAESTACLQADDPHDSRRVIELDQQHKDGHLVPTEVVTTLHTDAEGRPVSVLGVSRDITERRRAEMAQREASASLQLRLEEIQALQANIREQALHDSLTGLYNRRFLDENFERELARAKREGYPISLAEIDIDLFKRINDTYGHPAGDEVLRVLAAFLLEQTRPSDIVCRYGGEEFLLLMPNMGREHARARVEALREMFAQLVVQHGEFRIQTTFSVGVAAFPDHAHSVEGLTGAADLALYAAKHEGRNRVTVYSDVLSMSDT